VHAVVQMSWQAADREAACWRQEYTGIDWARLQKMEARLRNDILREAGAMGGRLLVARELTHGGRTLPGGDMEDDFETISGAGS
jgi:Inositol hexakisphosphate